MTDLSDRSLDSLAELQARLEALRADLQPLPQCEALQLKVEAALWELQDCERRRQQRVAGEALNGIYQARLRALQGYIADLQIQAEGFAAQCHQDSTEPDCPAPALVSAKSESAE
jgi:hypothetical protein